MMHTNLLQIEKHTLASATGLQRQKILVYSEGDNASNKIEDKLTYLTHLNNVGIRAVDPLEFLGYRLTLENDILKAELQLPSLRNSPFSIRKCLLLSIMRKY